MGARAAWAPLRRGREDAGDAASARPGGRGDRRTPGGGTPPAPAGRAPGATPGLADASATGHDTARDSRRGDPASAPGREDRSPDDEGARRAEDVATLLALARRWEAETGGSLAEFLDTVVLTDEDAPTGAAVEVLGLTLHAAKGLEFDTVVIVGAEEGLMPHYRHTAAETLAEERRLCYVGMTRAREQLVFSVARMRRLWGEVAFRPPSRFLREAGLDTWPRHGRWGRTHWSHCFMSTLTSARDAPSLPRLSPSRLEAWDRCPAAYRFEYVLRLPQPIGDQRPRLLGSVAHALLERYLRKALRSGTRRPLTTVSALAAVLVEEGDVPDASTELIREAAELVTRWLTLWAVPVEHLVAVEHALAVDASGRHVAWEAPDAFIRGRLDLVGRRGAAGHRLRLEERLGERGRGGAPASRGRRASTRPSSGRGRRGSRRSPSSTTTCGPAESPMSRSRRRTLPRHWRGRARSRRASPRPWRPRTIPAPSRPGPRRHAPRVPG